MAKQHGMLFADRLMPPLLDGRKTQTRRPVDPQPEWKGRQDGSLAAPGWSWSQKKPAVFMSSWVDDASFAEAVVEHSPYRVGDLIWARECWGDVVDCEHYNHIHGKVRYLYRADGDETCLSRWRPSIHMPKWACRCWLEITDVRVERIQEISEEDAKAEGTEKQFRTSVLGSAVAHIPNSYRGGFANSWSKIYPGSWERNDWVWALTFKRVEAPK